VAGFKRKLFGDANAAHFLFFILLYSTTMTKTSPKSRNSPLPLKN
jgi:hypothetical protein